MSKVKDIPTKSAAIVVGDSVLGVDSKDLSKTKRFLISALKTLFDGLYALTGHTHAHNETTALNTGDYQHLTAAQLAALPTDSAAAIARAVRWSKKYISGN